MISTYIIDDEAHAIDILRRYISQTPGLSLSGWTQQPQQALLEIKPSSAPDLTFLDIDMPGLSGIDLAGLVSPLTRIAFTTSYREYGGDAFEMNALDYILKPFSYERFLACVQKYRNMAGTAQATGKLPATFFVNGGTKGKLVSVNMADLVYIKGEQNYISLHLKAKEILTYLTLQEMMERLPHDQFLRIHKSYIVNTGYIRTIEAGHIRLEGNVLLPVGRTYLENFNERLRAQILLPRREMDHL